MDLKTLVRNKLFSMVDRIINLVHAYKISFYKYKYGDSIDIASDVAMGRHSSIVMLGSLWKMKLIIKNGCDFRKFCLITMAEDGHLVVGERNFFNNACSINCLNNIRIGDGNLFGEGVKVYDHNHVYSDIHIPIRNQGFSKGGVIIGSNCWFGSNCVILNNVTIGDNVVVGANVLVYKSIPSNTIVKSNATTTLKNRI